VHSPSLFLDWPTALLGRPFLIKRSDLRLSFLPNPHHLPKSVSPGDRNTTRRTFGAAPHFRTPAPYGLILLLSRTNSVFRDFTRVPPPQPGSVFALKPPPPPPRVLFSLSAFPKSYPSPCQVRCFTSLFACLGWPLSLPGVCRIPMQRLVPEGFQRICDGPAPAGSYPLGVSNFARGYVKFLPLACYVAKLVPFPA